MISVEECCGSNGFITVYLGPFPSVPGPPPIPTGKRRKKRHSLGQSRAMNSSQPQYNEALEAAHLAASQIMRSAVNSTESTEREVEGQLAVAAMLSLKLWRDRDLCGLLSDLEGGRYNYSLGRPGAAVLSLVASRLTYYFYAMNSKDLLACHI